MKTLRAMENREVGEVCWIACAVQEYYSQIGVEKGSRICKLGGWGNSAVFSCNGKRYAISEIADGIGVVSG